MIPVKTVRVGPFVIAIEHLKDEDRDSNFGAFWSGRQMIGMRDQFPNGALEAETLLHELLHAIYWAMGIRPKDTEERIIGLMSTGLAMAIRDNPKLFQWLSEALK